MRRPVSKQRDRTYIVYIGFVQGLQCSIRDVLALQSANELSVIVAKQFVRCNGTVFVLGLHCERVAVRAPRAEVWRPATEATFHALERVVARCTWAPLQAEDMLVLFPDL